MEHACSTMQFLPRHTLWDCATLGRFLCGFSNGALCTPIATWQVETREGDVAEYQANAGQSCLHCKTTLYSTLRSVAARAAQAPERGEPRPSESTSASVAAVTGPAGGVGRPNQGTEEGNDQECILGERVVAEGSDPEPSKQPRKGANTWKVFLP